MPEPLIDRLDRTIDAILAREDATAALADPELAPLARIAAGLRHAARPAFKTRLRAALERTTRTVTPYIIVSDDRLVPFLTRVFGARETFSARGGAGGMHREVRLGTSMLMIGELAGAEPKPMEFHVYVDDVDATFREALAAGATSLGDPADREYGERSGFIRDLHGNHWYIARALSGPPVPPEVRTVTPFLHPPDSAQYIGFLERAFGAVEEFRHAEGDRIFYARLRIGTQALELGEPGYTTMPGYFHLQVDNVDAAHERAVAAGATSVAAPAPQPRGGRSATVEDPMGNQWFIVGA
jgi:uncharacterized glyoxalase superfamily protein PhnB